MALLSFMSADNFLYDAETSQFLKDHAIVKDLTKEYRDPYFHHIFYVDDSNEEGDTVKSTLKSENSYEGNIGIIIDELTRPGSIAVDMGAHIGVHTIAMSEKVGSQGAVFSFEPNRKLYLEQLYNLELNGCKNVVPICKAVGECSKRAFYRWGWIDDSDSSGEGYEVEVAALDDYNLIDISLIKIDIENYEYLALQGAINSILRSKPVIIFECYLKCHFDAVSIEDQKINFERVISLLESLGYEISVIHCCNFIAFPKDSYPLSIYKKKFQKLDPDHYDPNEPAARPVNDYRLWFPESLP